MEQDREERVRARAYEIWERNGQQEGIHDAHWQQAVTELEEEDDAGEQQITSSASEETASTAPAGGNAEDLPSGVKSGGRARRP